MPATVPAPVSPARFWKRAFGLYILAELLYWVLNSGTTLLMCPDCNLHLGYNVLQLLLHILFTAALWWVLNKLYHRSLPIAIAGNVLVLVLYYFCWIALAYGMLYAWSDVLLGAKREQLSLRLMIKGSWFEVGKYVLKLTAFYALRFYYDYRKAEQQRLYLALVNKDMQLRLLRQQLSPHFYFNTLNNLYGLSMANSSKLPAALSQLSNIMQYVQVDCNRPEVPLSQEIKFLESYIELEKLRYETSTVIEVKTEGDFSSCLIVPLLLVQFVENAFKHGMKEKSEQSWMKVSIALRGSQLYFNTANSFTPAAPGNGIGLRSVKEILELQYEGRYTLDIKQEANCFSVTLKINLS
jgi:sensor histidine kinase YesM